MAKYENCDWDSNDITPYTAVHSARLTATATPKGDNWYRLSLSG